MSSKIITLSDSQDNTLIPKTKLEAISDANGNYLSSSLTASDINALTSNSVVTHDDISVHSSIPINADRLNGHPDTYFATADAITSLISSLTWKNIVTDQVGTAQIPLPTGWKELLAVIHVYDGSTYKVASASFYILPDMVLTSSSTLFRAGHMESSSSSSDICLRVNYDKASCALSDAVWNLSEKKSTSRISVWYR